MTSLISLADSEGARILESSIKPAGSKDLGVMLHELWHDIANGKV